MLPHESKFPLGRLLMTPGAQDALSMIAVQDALKRHLRGDWGELSDDDKSENDLSLREGYRLLSAYREGDTRFWIITEADRSATTVLLPNEY